MEKFNFSGTNNTHVCRNKEPHAPHILDEYKTVCHGWQQTFCLGREGNGIKITVDSCWPGDAAYPGTAKGIFTQE